jgi:hypothetical protein
VIGCGDFRPFLAAISVRLNRYPFWKSVQGDGLRDTVDTDKRATEWIHTCLGSNSDAWNRGGDQTAVDVLVVVVKKAIEEAAVGYFLAVRLAAFLRRSLFRSY